MTLTPPRFKPKPPPVQIQTVSCLNCGAEVSTKFCPECGQENEPLKLGIKYILLDAFEEFFKFDSKLLHTLKPLFIRPGFLTHEWARGRRINYISPFKLYLTATFVFFLVASWNFSRNKDTFLGDGKVVSTRKDKNGNLLDVKVHGPKEEPATSQTSDGEDDLIPADTVPSNEAEAFFIHNLRKIDLDNKEDVKEVIGQMLEKMPHALFVLLPVFAFLLKLVYIRRGRFYVEHLVFCLHNHSFHFLLLSITTPLPWKQAEGIALLGCVTYFILALKGYYNQSWPKTLFKGGMLGCGYLCLLGPTMLLAVFFGLMAMPDKKPDPSQKPTPKKEAKGRSTGGPPVSVSGGSPE